MNRFDRIKQKSATRAAVHNTTLGGDNYRVCGDYAGFAQVYVEQQYPAVPAMFLLGCAGAGGRRL